MKRKPLKKYKHEFQAVQYKHDLGQHFLYDTELLRTLVNEAGVSGKEQVLEIGAGAGTLTQVLCETGAQVTAVEVDDLLIPALKMMAVKYPNLSIIKQDIRKTDIHNLMHGEPFVVVANIPYSITSQIFDLFWGSGLPVRQMSVMIQKEVADKLTATPGDKAFGLMSIRCRYYCVPETIALVPASAFTPPPKVDSAFVKLTLRDEPPVPVLDEQLFWRLVKASYRMRRKTLSNALKSVLPFPGERLADILQSMDLSANTRGETLSVEQWITLTNKIKLSKAPYPAAKPR